jgi:hypothetical protein
MMLVIRLLRYTPLYNILNNMLFLFSSKKIYGINAFTKNLIFLFGDNTPKVGRRMGFVQRLLFHIPHHVKLDTVYLPTNQFRMGEKLSYIFKYIADDEYQVEEAWATLRAKEWTRKEVQYTDSEGWNRSSEEIREAYLYEDSCSHPQGVIGPDKPYNIEGAFKIPEDKGPSIIGCLEWTLEAKLTINGSSLIREVPITVLPIILVREGDDFQDPATSTTALSARPFPPTYGPHPEVL